MGIAAIAAVAGITFAMTFILPTHIASLRNQIEVLNVEVKVAQKSAVAEQGKASTLEADNKLLEHRLSETGRMLRYWQQANLFSVGNPYPVGLAKIRVGDPLDLIGKVYSASLIEYSKDIPYVSVKIDHGVFDDIIYYYEVKAQKKIIYMIAFSGSDSAEDLIYDKIVECLGHPVSVPSKVSEGPVSTPRDTSYLWKTSTNLGVQFEKQRGATYTVFAGHWWPKSRRNRPSNY